MSFKIKSIKPIKPIKPIDKLQNLKILPPLGKDEWVRGHWRYYYKTHKYHWPKDIGESNKE